MKKILWSLPVVAVVGLFFLSKACQNDPKNEVQIRLINALNDSIQYYKNQNNQLVSKISVIETENKETFLSLESKDKEILKLQELIKKNRNADVATIIENKTVYDTLVQEMDILNIYSNGIKLNEWTKGWFNGYIKFTPQLDKDDNPTGKADFDLSIEVNNKFRIVHKKDEKGDRFVEVFDENPYSKTKSIRSYYQLPPPEKKPKIKKFSIGPNLSYGVNHKGEFLPYIGVGVQYNLFKF